MVMRLTKRIFSWNDEAIVTRINHTAVNPATVHRITILQTAAQTSGRLLSIDYAVKRLEETKRPSGAQVS